MSTPSPPEVMKHVRGICRSNTLIRSKRGSHLLQYLVEAVLRNSSEPSLKERVIGVEVFGKPPSYEPHDDPIVRVSVRDLRKKLTSYYETEGRHSSIRIQIPLGSYAPVIYYEPTIASLKLSDNAAMCVVNARSAADRRTLPGFHAALNYLDSGLKDHPDHPRLLSLKALVHVMRATYGCIPSEEIGTARLLIERAKQQGFELWELCVAEAEVSMELQFDWAGADRLFDRALQLSHGESRYNAFHAAHLACQLRLEEFLDIKRSAVSHFAHDSVYARCELSMAQIFLKRYGEAEDTLRETLALFPADRYMPFVHLAVLYEARGEFTEAARAIESISIPLQHSVLTAGVRGLMAGLAGDRRMAEQVHRELLRLRETGAIFIPASQLANSAMGVERDDEAMEWFRMAAFDERDPIMNWIALIPFERHLLRHSGFRDFVTKTMKLRFPE